jgi:hypothetical protein
MISGNLYIHTVETADEFVITGARNGKPAKPKSATFTRIRNSILLSLNTKATICSQKAPDQRYGN